MVPGCRLRLNFGVLFQPVEPVNQGLLNEMLNISHHLFGPVGIFDFGFFPNTFLKENQVLGLAFGIIVRMVHTDLAPEKCPHGTRKHSKAALKQQQCTATVERGQFSGICIEAFISGIKHGNEDVEQEKDCQDSPRTLR